MNSQYSSLIFLSEFQLKHMGTHIDKRTHTSHAPSPLGSIPCHLNLPLQCLTEPFGSRCSPCSPQQADEINSLSFHFLSFLCLVAQFKGSFLNMKTLDLYSESLISCLHLMLLHQNKQTFIFSLSFISFVISVCQKRSSLFLLTDLIVVKIKRC